LRIGEDKGQQAGKHKIKQKWFSDNKIELTQIPLPVGDYIEITEAVQSVIDRRGVKLKKMDFMGSYRVSIDTKKDLQECVGNIQGKSHARFRDECILGQQNGIKLYILVEHGGNIKSLEDVANWINPRIYLWEKKIRKEWNIPKDVDFQTELAELKSHGAKIKRGPTTGEELYKAMVTMQEKYGCEFVFCDKSQTGKKIIKLLGGESVDDRAN
jgi:ribosome-associated protein